MNAILKSVPPPLDPRDLALIESVQDGLPLTAAPYAAVGEGIGMTETEVIQRLGKLLERGYIKRLGVVVRHHELGYRANAMVVWNIADDQVDSLARRMAAYPFVTLCYRRPRRPPDWPYNLFCMIHGRYRDTVLACVARLAEELELTDTAHEVLFSRRRFKQRGARFRGLNGRTG